MVNRINGAAVTNQNITGSLTYYVCYAASPMAFTSPNPNPTVLEDPVRLVNILMTGSPKDTSQKNFEVLLMSIGLRAMPCIITTPLAVQNLADYTVELSGEGFVWKFAVERDAQFQNYTPYGTPGPVGLLIDDIDGVILSSGVRLTTVTGSPSGWGKNITFEKIDTL